MVYWITGRPNSGKTTLAKRLKKQTGGIIIDGDHIRDYFPTGYSESDRYENIMRISKFAKMIEDQGNIAIIACVSPSKKIRKECQKMFKECIEIELPFGEDVSWGGLKYEEEEFE
jgi:adenylylsulfate kinase-like enzyme